MAQDIILETTMEFIKRNEDNLKLALRVEKAMPRVRKDLCWQVLDAVKEALEARRENEAVLDTWNICSSYGNDNKDLMEGHSYLALRRNGWDIKNKNPQHSSGVQIQTEGRNWGDVWFGVCFPRGYEEQHAAAMQNTLNAFGASGSAIMVGNVSGNMFQMWKRCRFRDWSQDKFMMAARSDLLGIVGELVNELTRLAELVDNHFQVIPEQL